MATFSKIKFTQSEKGTGILLGDGDYGPNTIHQAVGGTNDWDEIWIYAVNDDTSDIVIVIGFGSYDAKDNITISIPPQSGLQLIVPGFILNDDAVVYAYATTADKVTLHGFINRMTI